MISRAKGAKIYLALESVDVRKAVGGLAILVSETLKQDPQYGTSRNERMLDKNKERTLPKTPIGLAPKILR